MAQNSPDYWFETMSQKTIIRPIQNHCFVSKNKYNDFCGDVVARAFETFLFNPTTNFTKYILARPDLKTFADISVGEESEL